MTAEELEEEIKSYKESLADAEGEIDRVKNDCEESVDGLLEYVHGLHEPNGYLGYETCNHLTCIDARRAGGRPR